MAIVKCGEFGTRRLTPRANCPGHFDSWYCTRSFGHDGLHGSTRTGNDWDGGFGAVSVIPRHDEEVLGAHVYFLQNRHGDIKIGKSINVSSRIAALATGAGTPKLLAIIENGGLPIESVLHEKFKKDRIESRREWFIPSDKLIKFINDLRTDFHYSDNCEAMNKYG